MRRWRSFLPVFCCLLGLGSPARCVEPTGSWATGIEIKRQLATPASVSWDRVPLARGLATLSRAQRLAIVLDRRIDPDQPVNLAAISEPLSDILERLAAQLGVGYCQLGPVAYLGPAEMAQRLRTLAAMRLDETRALPAASARKFLAMRSWPIEELAEPVQLAVHLATEAGVEMTGAEKIPHDLWPAADWPPLSWLDRLTLLLAQFDLTFRIVEGGQRIEVLPVSDKVQVTRSYAAGRDGKAVAQRWAKDLPAAQVSLTDGKIRVAARVEDHEAIETRMRGKPLSPPPVALGIERYQLSIENASLAKVINELADRLNLTVTWDKAAIESAGLSADQLVTVKIQDADLDRLLRAVFQGTGLGARRNDRTVTIVPVDGARRDREQ
jgi:hypothetical protein